MFRICLPIQWLCCAGAACLFYVPSPAAAQDTSQSSPSYRSVAPIVPSPYWGYSWNPYHEMLAGAALVIQAEADFRVK